MATTCHAHCTSCNICFGGSDSFSRHLHTDGHRDPSAVHLVPRPGTCAHSVFLAARAGAEAYSAALAKARQVSKLAGRKGLLSKEELHAVHEAANRAEAAQPPAAPVPTTVWSQISRFPAGGGRVRAFDA